MTSPILPSEPVTASGKERLSLDIETFTPDCPASAQAVAGPFEDFKLLCWCVAGAAYSAARLALGL